MSFLSSLVGGVSSGISSVENFLGIGTTQTSNNPTPTVPMNSGMTQNSGLVTTQGGNVVPVSQTGQTPYGTGYNPSLMPSLPASSGSSLFSGTSGMLIIGGIGIVAVMMLMGKKKKR
jgi:hypothetical protein